VFVLSSPLTSDINYLLSSGKRHQILSHQTKSLLLTVKPLIIRFQLRDRFQIGHLTGRLKIKITFKWQVRNRQDLVVT